MTIQKENTDPFEFTEEMLVETLIQLSALNAAYEALRVIERHIPIEVLGVDAAMMSILGEIKLRNDVVNDFTDCEKVEDAPWCTS